MRLRAMASYRIGGTHLIAATNFAPIGRLFVKIESENATGSIKDRPAYFVMNDLLRHPKFVPGICLVESTSGNFGMSLQLFAKEMRFRLLCVVDPTIGRQKLDRLTAAGAELEFVTSADGNHRAARLKRAKELDATPGFLWPNQFGNPANVAAHEETTGPEIWEQTNGTVTTVVCAVGTGGTVCGVGRALKARAAQVNVVAVEPHGSTIFAGVFEPYLNVGAGLPEPSAILRRFGSVIDSYAKVPDDLAVATALEFAEKEGVGVGVTSGMVLAVSRGLAARRPEDVIVAVAPDGADNYEDVLISQSGKCQALPEVINADSWCRRLDASDDRSVTNQ